MSGSDNNVNDQSESNNDHDQDGSDNDPKEEKDQQPKTYTQAEIDRIVRERLQRDRAKQPSAEELKSLREKAAEHDRLKAESLSAEERAKADKDAAESRATQAEERARKTALRAEIASACAAASVSDVAAVRAILNEDHASEIKWDDDGEPTNIDELVKKILKDRPYLKGSKFDGGGDGGSKGGGKQDLSDPEYLATLPMSEYMELKAQGKI